MPPIDPKKRQKLAERGEGLPPRGAEGREITTLSDNPRGSSYQKKIRIGTESELEEEEENGNRFLSLDRKTGSGDRK